LLPVPFIAVYFSNSNAKPKTDGLFPIPDHYF